MIESVLTRDLPAFGVRVPAAALSRFWGMLAHLQGQLFNASQLGQALGGMAHTTVGRYLDLMVDAMLVRRLPPYFINIGKRLVKSPKVYVRDSGLLHALLNLPDIASLQRSPVAGASWEGFVIEQIAAALPRSVPLSFYRTAKGAELDLVIEAGQRRVGVEIKLSAAPKPARGFWEALKDLKLEQAFVVAPVSAAYPLAQGVSVLPISELGRIGEALNL
jgi:predicted AAA+ superfamily ATPase